MIRSSLAVLSAGMLLGAIVSACTSDEDTAVTEGACQMVVDACHPKDDGSDDVINGCHSRAHDGDDAVCSTDLQQCLDVCNAADPVGGSGGHMHDSGEETSHEDHGDHGDHGETTAGDHGDGTSTSGGTTGTDPSTSSTGADDSSQASCDELGSICHDSTDEFGQMCHDVGHDGTEEECAAIWVECLEVCLE